MDFWGQGTIFISFDKSCCRSDLNIIQAHIPGYHVSEYIWWEPEINSEFHAFLISISVAFWSTNLVTWRGYCRNFCPVKSQLLIAQQPDGTAGICAWGEKKILPPLTKTTTFESYTWRSIWIIIGPGPKMGSSQEVQGVGTRKLWIWWEIMVWREHGAPLGHFC